MAAHFATHSDIWIEEEVFIPTNFVSTGVGPWISIMDFHSVGANRWHTDPGLFMCSSVNGCAAGDIGKLAARNYQGTIFAGPSTMPVPINQWFKLQVHWIWSTTPVPITYYINGVQVLQIVAPTKEGPDQTTVEWYNKFYGDDAGGSWTPNPMVRYTRNIMFSDAMIGGTTPPPRHNRSLHTSRPHDASPCRIH